MHTKSLNRIIVGLLMVMFAVGAAHPIAAQESISFEITPLGESGISGSGTTTPGATAEESTHTIQLQGLAPGSVHAVSQYHGTSCTNYDAAPEFVFANITADSQGKAAASFPVKKPFANWPRRPHFMIIHGGAEGTTPAVACGMIVVAAPATAAPSAPAAPAALPATGGGDWPITIVLAGLGVLGIVSGLGVKLHRRHSNQG
jgi:LPXTG-motif cell wall-anchored protein